MTRFIHTQVSNIARKKFCRPSGYTKNQAGRNDATNVEPALTTNAIWSSC